MGWGLQALAKQKKTAREIERQLRGWGLFILKLYGMVTVTPYGCVWSHMFHLSGNNRRDSHFTGS